MSRIAFDQLPDSSRLWIFAADRVLAPAEQARLNETVEAGLAAWSAHGSPVRWGYRLMHDQFLAIGVDETHTALSGCSIDNAVRRIRALEDELGLSFLDNARVFYREGEDVRQADRPGFRALAEAGKVTADTVVFNTVIATVGEFRAGRWEVPARDSWHAQAFPVAGR